MQGFLYIIDPRQFTLSGALRFPGCSDDRLSGNRNMPDRDRQFALPVFTAGQRAPFMISFRRFRKYIAISVDTEQKLMM